MHKVVIVGAGFAGLKAARELAKDRRFQVTLVTDKLNFEYHAALYRTATGRSKLEVVVPLEQVLAHSSVDLVQDTAEKVNPESKQLLGKSGQVYPYDTLILALGVVTAYYGIAGLAEYSYGIKSTREALDLKRHLHEELTTHEMDSHFVVIGGGPSGVELAGELVAYLHQITRKHKVTKKFQVDLVEAAPRILPALPEDQATKISDRLQTLGVKIFTDTAVKGETVNQLQLPDGQIDTHTVIWTAGVTNNPFFKAQGTVFTLGKGDRVQVGPDLSAGAGIYVLGDSAGSPKSGWAQTALYDGKFVASNLKRQLRGKKPLPYQPHQPVGAIPVGPKWAAVSAGNRRYYGLIGWWYRRWIDLKLFTGFMPLGKGIRVWLYGNQTEETCPVCAKRK